MRDKLTDLEISELRELAMYIQGYLHGKGDLSPCGTHTLETLWKAIKLLK